MQLLFQNKKKLNKNLRATNRQFADTLRADVAPVEISENNLAAVTQEVTHDDSAPGLDDE